MIANPHQRLNWIVRTVNLLRLEIEQNGDRYDGRMIPNLTSLTDLATLEDEVLARQNIEASLAKLERERGVRR